MPHVRKIALPRQYESWSALAVEGEQAGGGLASSSYAMPGFFVGWVAVGVLIAAVLVARGHDARTMIGLGVGLGPLMVLVASETIRRRETSAAALVIETGVDHGGLLDVLVVVRGCPSDVRSVRPTLDSVRFELGTLTVAQPVAYELVEGDLDNELVSSGRDVLIAAAEELPVLGAELVLWPGTVEAVAERFRRRHPQGLVLFATAEPDASTTTSD